MILHFYPLILPRNTKRREIKGSTKLILSETFTQKRDNESKAGTVTLDLDNPTNKRSTVAVFSGNSDISRDGNGF